MNNLQQDDLKILRHAGEPPCLSLFLPTHRHHPDNQQDPIRYRNLVKSLQASLELKYPTELSQERLEPFLMLAEDRPFWNQTLDGLAVFGSSKLFRFYRLQRPVAELANVGTRFHIKPLFQILQALDRYQVLALTRDSVRLYEGTRDVLDELEMDPKVPKTMVEALGADLTEPHQTVASYGGTGRQSSPMHHGHGGRTASTETDTERFFRAVDRAVVEHHSQPSGLPLILATLPEHSRLFHLTSHNPQLIKAIVDSDPNALSVDQLRQRAWQVIEPAYRAKLETLIAEFREAKARDLAGDGLVDVARAVVAGRTAKVLVEAGREISGHLDRMTGDLTFGEATDPEIDDLLNDLADMAMEKGSEVSVIPAQQMPSASGIAAIYRF